VTALAVEALDVHASIGGSKVLQGINLNVPSPGFTAILGRNGVGKTTTLRTLIGQVKGTSKEGGSASIRILGLDVAGWPTHKIIRLGVGYVPEDREVFARLTVRENLRLAEFGTAGAGRNANYDRVYALFPELKQRSRQPAGTLSGGQQQMLAIGRVLLADRPLLLVDEPTKGLSPKFVSEVVDVLERVRETATVLMVEQNVHVVRRLAQQVVVLAHGQVAHAGPASELEDESLVRRFLGVSQ